MISSPSSSLSSPTVWLITGAARGIGAALVRAALEAGHRVVATSRHLASVPELPEAGDALLRLPLNVDDEAQAQAAVAEAVARFGRIDVLVNNAGYGQLGLFEEIEPADIERQFATNVFGLMHVTRSALPVMRQQRSGRIFNLSSLGGSLGFAGAAIYCATKFAVEGFSESLALEVAPFGIHVTAVAPGFTRTDFLDTRSVRYGSRTVVDYADASQAIQAGYEAYNHQQAGDPARLATALLQVAASDAPPLHFATGSDALAGVGDALARHQAELQAWAALTRSVDRTAA